MPKKFKKPYDPGESKHRFCDPGACHCCEDQGGGNFYCRFANVMVVRNWENTEHERICKQGRRPQDLKPAPTQKKRKPYKGRRNLRE